MDKTYLLTYTSIASDGFRHAGHAWFANEEAMRRYIDEMKARETGIEVDFAIEIQQYREILV